MQILFFDVTTPLSYTDITRKSIGLGGTEATVTRVAHALAEHHEVIVAQHCRTADEISNGVKYTTLSTANRLKPTCVILLRNRRWLEKIGRQFPSARHFFWMHNMPSKKLFFARPIFSKYNYQIIAVSDFHRNRIKRRLKGNFLQQLIRPQCINWPTVKVHTLHNPIDEKLTNDHTPWNPKQMILASSPTKGLWLTLKSFEKIRETFPEYELLIATYSVWDKNQKLPENVKFLGSLPQHELLQKMRESFCMFYPQNIRCETFGLVYAEANAVGTPVLAHDFGAASEVLSDACQLINGQKINSILNKIKEWKINRPSVKANPNFKLEFVKAKWLKLLNQGT